MKGQGHLEAAGEGDAAGQHGCGGAGFVGAEAGYALDGQDGGMGLYRERVLPHLVDKAMRSSATCIIARADALRRQSSHSVARPSSSRIATLAYSQTMNWPSRSDCRALSPRSAATTSLNALTGSAFEAASTGALTGGSGA